MRHHRTLFSFLLSTALASTGTFAQTTPQPSYDDTVAWLQGVSASGFVEFKRCEFEHLGQRVEFGKLSSSGVMRHGYSVDNRVVSNCAKGGACVRVANGASSTAFIFEKRDNMDDSRVITALRHLVLLCGAVAVPDKLF